MFLPLQGRLLPFRGDLPVDFGSGWLCLGWCLWCHLTRRRGIAGRLLSFILRLLMDDSHVEANMLLDEVISPAGEGAQGTLEWI